MKFRDVDKKITLWLGQYGLKALRFSVAIIFIWFGFLKVIDYSPATEIVKQTVYWFNPGWFIPFLGWWEVVIGLCFLSRRLLRVGIALLVPQMLGTFLPLILLPEITFQTGSFLLPTLEGQYIIKNLVIIAAAMVIGATVRKHHEKLK
ncbi:MAG: hypothetical protein ACP5NS_00565 [Candidatus Pacearchaeota archaeon]